MNNRFSIKKISVGIAVCLMFGGALLALNGGGTNLRLQEALSRQLISPPVVAPAPVQLPTLPSKDTTLSNDNYYINVDRNKVHSPAYSDSVPVGVTAQCADGTYSFSQHRRGTCSHHGGVARWLY